MNEYYKTSGLLKEAEKFIYKCHSVLAHYAFLTFTIISDVVRVSIPSSSILLFQYHDLLKWYESQGKKSIGFIVEPLQVGAQMLFEIAKDVFWMAVGMPLPPSSHSIVRSELLQKTIARSTVFLERVFAVWSKKGLGAAIDEAFQQPPAARAQ